tara:strand:+ start:739 stop:876 length:138 start_codon:yes stop_codon:yes gene_type:complete
MKINPFTILIFGGILIFILPLLFNYTPTVDNSCIEPNMGMTRICP